MSVLERARLGFEATLVRAAMGLPAPVQRLLAGRPVRLDGLRLDTDVQLMLRLQQVARMPGLADVPLDRCRTLMREMTSHTGGHQPVGAVRELRVAGLPARLYVPLGAEEPGPLLVYFHGGGFFCGDLDTHDPTCRFLAERAGARVLSVDYRLGPEHAFPAAHDDAETAYAWAVEHAADLGADPARIGVGGDSAGGNLAAWVALEAARRDWPCAVQVLIYPATSMTHPFRSAELFGHGFVLETAFMDQAVERYAAPPGEPRLVLLDAELPVGSDAGRIAPALVYTAGFDPLRDEGEAYGARLRAAGVEVSVRRFDGQIHGFVNLVGAGRSGPAAMAEVATALARSLAVPAFA